MAFPKISEQIYEMLLKHLIDQKFKPGTRLIEEQLCRDLGVSRTPLRDAISALAKDGFIKVEPRRGASVPNFQLKDLIEVYDIRMALEGLAAKLAAGNINYDILARLVKEFSSTDVRKLLKADISLHRIIIESCNNAKLQEMLTNLDNLIQAFRSAGYKSKSRSQSATKYHIRIVKALIDGDGGAAERLMREHIDKTKHEIIHEFKMKTENS
jgi:GntR family transcriptional regulator, rspAB operon transcriptional repressor